FLRAPAGMDPEAFARLEAAAQTAAPADPAHDFFHVARVVRSAEILARSEEAPELPCVLAALLHELFSFPKDHPDSPRSGDVCAEKATVLLAREGVDRVVADEVALAIRDHAFSKGVVPQATTARILQDADRLDAIGAIGLA